MTIKDQISLKFRKIGAHIKHPKLIGLKTLEKFVDYIGPVASVLSIGAKPTYNIPERIFYGPYQTISGLYDLTHTIASNMGILDFSKNVLGSGLGVFKNMMVNAVDKPLETLISAASV